VGFSSLFRRGRRGRLRVRVARARPERRNETATHRAAVDRDVCSGDGLGADLAPNVIGFDEQRGAPCRAPRCSRRT
jgi:hypothetical protein